MSKRVAKSPGDQPEKRYMAVEKTLRRGRLCKCDYRRSCSHLRKYEYTVPFANCADWQIARNVRNHWSYITPKESRKDGAVDKTSSSFSAHGKIGNFIIIISSSLLCSRCRNTKAKETATKLSGWPQWISKADAAVTLVIGREVQSIRKSCPCSTRLSRETKTVRWHNV